jgi:hypothetical protein
MFDLSPDDVNDELLEDLYSGHLPENDQDMSSDEESRAPVLQ